MKQGISNTTTHALEVGMTGNFLDATGTTRVTNSVTTSVGSSAFKRTVGFLGNKFVGGLLEVGLNYLEGDYDLYEPTPREQFANGFSVSYDFTTGTIKSAVAGTAAVGVGTFVTGIALPTGPAAPVFGVSAGAGTAFVVDYGLSELLFKPIKPLAVRFALAGYDSYQYVAPYHEAAIDFTSQKLIEPFMNWFRK